MDNDLFKTFQNINIANKSLASLLRVLLFITIFIILFLFTNLTTDFYDTPKFLLLLVFVGLGLILTTVRFVLSDKVVLIRTPLDLPLILLLAVGIVSTVLSPSPYISLFGNQLKIHGSLISLIAYVLFYLSLVNNLKGFKDVRQINFLLLGGSIILSVITLLAYFGVYMLPKPWTQGVNFTPTGSNFSTTAILAMLLPFSIIEVLRNNNLLFKIFNAVLITLFGVVIALTGTLATIAASLAGLGITLAILRPKLSGNLGTGLPALVASLVVVFLITALSFIPPLGQANNPLYTLAKNFPRNPELSFPVSWKISVSAFRDSPFWGTGPSTYLFNFTQYKPIEFNSTKFWNIRFDLPFNEYLHLLANLGGVGLIALLSLTALFISSSSKVLINGLPERAEGSTPLEKLTLSLAIGGAVFFTVLALHSSTLVVMVIGFLLLGMFMVLNAREPSQYSGDYLRGGIKQTLLRISSPGKPTQEVIKVDALPSVLLTVSIGLAGFAFFFGGKLAWADYHHRNALNAVSQNNGILAYNELVAAEKLNPYSDLYRTDLAQTNFALANAIAVAKGPTEASPGGSLTDQDKVNIQTLLQQAINEGRTATTLSPKSAINWEILGALYRQISGVAENALLFSLDSYGRAILNDPLNPLLRLNVGGTYYAVKNYDLAIRFFTDSVNLKPDFPNGFYNLSVALRDKGDLNSAIAAAERVVSLITDTNSQDYKLASDYLNELKSKVEKPSTQEPPAAQAEGALQQEELPKVIDLPKPEKIATPSAVKKPNSTPEPSPNP